ncbi:MAG TPA: DUF4369 domain-containing protein, partial [Bacteroides sp.]|nr:DUF4369 domain-containing protein [Bacteroides sp.]
MKHRSLLFLIPLIALFACNRNRVTITGVVEEGARTKISLERLDVSRTTVIDTVLTGRDGSFTFTTRIDEPHLMLLRNDNGEILNLLPFPGDRISVTTTCGTFGTGYRVGGSPESEKIRSLVEHLHHTRTTIDSLVTVADSVSCPDDPRLALARTAFRQALVDQKRYTIRFIVENMKSLSSIYALYQKFDDENFILAEESDLQYYK